MSLPPQRILLTGANGSLGRHWFRNAETIAPGIATRALVRSQRAVAEIEALGEDAQPEEIRVVDYGDPEDLAEAAKGCDAAIHLVGILRETPSTTYAVAHEASCRALARAAQEVGLHQIVYPSIFGADPSSRNACLASKGRAERILLDSPAATTVLRLPMVLGPGEAAAQALASQARSGFVALVGGGATLQQPIDVRDVVAALRSAATNQPPRNAVLELGGPEILSHAALLTRAAKMLGHQEPRIVGIPAALVRAASAVLETFLRHPPINRTVLEVLEHNDSVDNGPACAALGLALRDLDTTLRYGLLEEEDPA